MRDEELDRILSDEPGVVPSSGFTVAVMEAVRREAATPPPIPFPWKRALPGLAAWLVVLVVAVFSSHSGAALETAGVPFWPRFLSAATAALATAGRFGVGWVALALLLSLVSVTLSMRLTGWRS
ncbi:MAG TPA: hypothetical protein VGF16_18525 [Bryobacteraceae bacterium]